jgi:hypothetical protein
MHLRLEFCGGLKFMTGFINYSGGRKLSEQKGILDNKEGLHLPTDAKERKKIPLFTGLVKYFPDALIAVAKVSYAGNEQHNPGQPLHWAREKSTDQEDTMLRHLWESGTIDVDGQRHSAKMAWRALAILQLEIEAERNASKE